jgi:hypothetical protein
MVLSGSERTCPGYIADASRNLSKHGCQSATTGFGRESVPIFLELLYGKIFMSYLKNMFIII